MKYTQILSFEITGDCNRGASHTKCPNRHPDRWRFTAGFRPTTDDQIVSIARAAHATGFEGQVAWHHYCEPLMAWPRVRDLCRRIRTEVPRRRFLLWTNGDLFPQDLSEFDGLFETIIVTNYSGRDQARLATICRDLRFVGPDLDWRMDPPRLDCLGRCLRPYVEVVVDYYGNLRPCCWDWQGETALGNVHDTPWPVLWRRWLARRAQLAGPTMDPHAPQRCRTCGSRCDALPPYDPTIAARALDSIPTGLVP